MADVTAGDIRSEISGLLKASAEPVRAGESIKTLIRRAAMRLGLQFNRARKLWYEEILNIPAHEAETIRRKALRICKHRRQVMAMDDEVEDLRRRIAALEEMNAAIEKVVRGEDPALVCLAHTKADEASGECR